MRDTYRAQLTMEWIIGAGSVIMLHNIHDDISTHGVNFQILLCNFSPAHNSPINYNGHELAKLLWRRYIIGESSWIGPVLVMSIFSLQPFARKVCTPTRVIVFGASTLLIFLQQPLTLTTSCNNEIIL